VHGACYISNMFVCTRPASTTSTQISSHQKSTTRRRYAFQYMVVVRLKTSHETLSKLKVLKVITWAGGGASDSTKSIYSTTGNRLIWSTWSNERACASKATVLHISSCRKLMEVQAGCEREWDYCSMTVVEFESSAQYSTLHEYKRACQDRGRRLPALAET